MSMILQQTEDGLTKVNLGNFYGEYPRPHRPEDHEMISLFSAPGEDEFEPLRRMNDALKDIYSATVKEVDDGTPGCLSCKRQARDRSMAEDVTAPESNVSTSAYRYEPLPDPSTCIRVLNLQPATSEDAPLRAELSVCRNRASTKYAALSYTWTGIDGDSKLYLQTGELDITGNLDRALRALRKRDSVLDIWVDAVCINQQDNKEKGPQVAQMAEIYKSAEIVLAWLGLESDYTKEAIDFLTQLADLGTRKYADEIERLAMPLLRSVPMVSLTDDDASWINSAQKTAHVEDVYTRLWFKRLWVVQEALLAERIELHIGPNVLPWEAFRSALKMMLSADQHFAQGMHQGAAEIQDPLGPAKHAHFLTISRDSLDPLKKRKTLYRDYAYSTYGVAKDLVDWGCKDDRDRIYAILGLIPVDSRIAMRPDYDATPEQVYIEFAREHIRKEGLIFLLLAGLESRPDDVITGIDLFRQAALNPGDGYPDMPDTLPSWVPEPRPEKRRDVTRGWRPAFFDAAMSRTPAVVLHQKCPHIIAVRGCVFDGIVQPLPTSIIEPLLEGDIVMDFVQAIEYVSFIWIFSKDYFKEKGTYTTDEAHRTLFQTVLTSDGSAQNLKVLTGRKDPGWIDRMFDLLIQCAEARSTTLLTASMLTGEIEQWEFETFLGGLSRNLHVDHVMITRDGSMGLAPKQSQAGDVIAWINELSAPVVLRPLFPEGPYWLVGPCFVHGVMYGELNDRGSDEAATTFLELI